MISSQDRSGWFGASDTDFIVGNWETASFENWWLTKIGINKSNFQNQYTLAGRTSNIELFANSPVGA